MTTFIQNEAFQSNAFGDSYLYSVNQEDFNSFGSKAALDQRLGATLFQEHRLYFIVGTDSGLLPRYIHDTGIPVGSRYIFIEPTALYSKLHSLIDGMDERFIFCTPENAISSIEEQTELGAAYYVYRNHAEIIQSIGCQNDYSGYYSQIASRLSEELHDFRFKVTGTINLRHHYVNQILNVVDEPNPAPFLIDLFQGKTAVVLAGGPSLPTGLPWVKKHRKDLLVIAVSRICRQLVEEQLTPDIVVTTDPTNMSFDISKELFQLKGCLFAHQPGSIHLLVGQWGGMKTYFGPRLPWPSEINSDNLVIGSGNTISNLAIDLAAVAGANQIILFGVDLCHAADGYTHAAGSNERNCPPPIWLNTLEVKTNGGSMREATPDLYQSAQSLNAHAEQLKGTGTRIINPAPDAVRLQNIEHIPVDEIIIQPMDRPPIETLQEAYPDTPAEDYLDRVEEALADAQTQLRDLKKNITRGTKILNRIAAGKPSRKNPFQLIEKIRQRISDNNISVATRQIVWDEFSKISITLESNPNIEPTRELAAKEYFDACLAGYNKMKMLLDEAQQRLDARREELKPEPDFKLLFSQAEKDKQFGRAAIWKERFPNQFNNLNSNSRKLIEQMLAAFDTELHKSDAETDHIKRQKAFADINNALPRIINLFIERNDDGLKRFHNSLKCHPASVAKPFIDFCLGMQAELAGDQSLAINHYEQILSCANRDLLEHTLKRISGICIETGNLENAVLAINGLTHISDRYYFDYANILSGVGALDEAYEAYLQYLDSHPNDSTALIKLGLLSIQMNKLDTASQVLDQLKAINPGSHEYANLYTEIERHRDNGN